MRLGAGIGPGPRDSGTSGPLGLRPRPHLGPSTEPWGPRLLLSTAGAQATAPGGRRSAPLPRLLLSVPMVQHPHPRRSSPWGHTRPDLAGVWGLLPHSQTGPRGCRRRRRGRKDPSPAWARQPAPAGRTPAPLPLPAVGPGPAPDRAEGACEGPARGPPLRRLRGCCLDSTAPACSGPSAASKTPGHELLTPGAAGRCCPGGQTAGGRHAGAHSRSGPAPPALPAPPEPAPGVRAEG